MILPADQRHLLGAFLRSRREAQPATGDRRRRTPGLRREEVAERCGISTTWYTWLEQGRDVSPSGPALARLSDTLHLTAAERAYLFELARIRDPAPGAAAASAVPPELEAVLNAASVPAYLLDRHWRALAWNSQAARLFAPWLDSGERCLLRYVFLDPGAASFIGDWDDRARRLVAEFRADTAHDPDDPGMQALCRELLHGSAAFARFWNEHAVLAREGGARRFNHPLDGERGYQQVTLIPATHPGCKLVMLLPAQ